MQRVQVDSSSISEVGYDQQFSTLEVLFSDGKLYQYFDVPQHVHEALMTAPSVGKFFSKEIRGVYRYARV